MWPCPLEKWYIYVHITASWEHFGNINKDKKQWNFCPPNQQNVKDKEWAQLFVLLLELSIFSKYRRGSTNISDSNVIRVFKTLHLLSLQQLHSQHEFLHLVPQLIQLAAGLVMLQSEPPTEERTLRLWCRCHRAWLGLCGGHRRPVERWRRG